MAAGSAERHMPPVRQQAQLPDSGAGRGEKHSNENPQRAQLCASANPCQLWLEAVSGSGIKKKRESPRDDYRLRRLVSLLDQSWRVDVRQPPTTRSVPERVRQP